MFFIAGLIISPDNIAGILPRILAVNTFTKRSKNDIIMSVYFSLPESIYNFRFII